MKKKGFTLIELLAVIVILAIIALIAIPLIGNVIEKAKIGALENSVNGLVESANMYYANQSIKGEQAIETVFDFANGEQTSTSKLEYKGKVYNGKLILHANGEVAVCIDDKEHYAYKNKDSDEIISGIGTCVYDGTTGDFSSNSSIKDLRGKTVVATNVTQSADGLSTLITIPEEGHYDTNSIISIPNSNLEGSGGTFITSTFSEGPYNTDHAVYSAQIKMSNSSSPSIAKVLSDGTIQIMTTGKYKLFALATTVADHPSSYLEKNGTMIAGSKSNNSNKTPVVKYDLDIDLNSGDILTFYGWFGQYSGDSTVWSIASGSWIALVKIS